MIILKKLYSKPVAFDSISFESGINIILGEKFEGNNKTNGVGKSMSIEFINFCLLKKTSDSRVTLIPENVLDSDTVIYLDLILNNELMTIARAIKTPDIVTIFKNTEEIVFDKLDDVSAYLSNLYFKDTPVYTSRISFRSLLAPLLRDERSEFKDIIQCFDTKKRIPNDYKPHLFFLNMNIDLYSETKSIITDLKNKATYFSETKKLLISDFDKVSEAKAKLNELESEVNKINTSIEQLKNNESFDSVQNDLIKIELNLDKLRIRQKAIKYEIKQINTLPEPENISEKEIVLLFNQFKDGLGKMVEKSLKELKGFKSRIDTFRDTIVNNNLEKLKTELLAINAKIQKLDDDYSEKISLLDNGELLRDLKTSIRIFNNKNQELNNLRALIERYDKADKEKKTLKNKKDNMIVEYDSLIYENKKIISDFEKTILNIHESIIDNKNAHFEISTYNSANSKEFLLFNLRTYDDGSWGTNRLKVFIYDLALMLDNNTKKNHPCFLVHDNIFNFDNDSIEKSLNFIHKQAQNHPEEFQYILTLNRDMVEIMEERKLLDFNIESYRRASYTKNERFLKKKYSELDRKVK